MSRISIIEQIRVAVLNNRHRELRALSLTIAGHHAKVANYKRLLMLSREEQVLVHEGKLGVSAALDLLVKMSSDA
jgi:hypothetical protein